MTAYTDSPHRFPYLIPIRAASPDNPYSQITRETTETRVVNETVDATIISSQ